MRFLFDYLDIDFRSELPHIDEIRYGKQHVLKKIMELADEMQVFCQLRIKAFIPIRRRTVHRSVKHIYRHNWAQSCG